MNLSTSISLMSGTMFVFFVDYYDLLLYNFMINNYKLNQDWHAKSETILIAYSIYEHFGHIPISSRLRKNAIYKTKIPNIFTFPPMEFD